DPAKRAAPAGPGPATSGSRPMGSVLQPGMAAEGAPGSTGRRRWGPFSRRDEWKRSPRHAVQGRGTRAAAADGAGARAGFRDAWAHAMVGAGEGAMADPSWAKH